MVRTGRIWYVIGVVLPVAVYYIQGGAAYLKTLTSNKFDYIELPKYKKMVWKIHRLMSVLSPYYLALSKDGKKVYISRLIHVILQKKFVAKEGETITMEKKIIILAGLVQLTYGLRKFSVPSFRKVALYPGAFYSGLIRKHVKGLTFARGYVLFSWTDTFKGFHLPNDNLNLALHEWSHAFVLDHSKDRAFPLYLNINWRAREMTRAFEEMKDKSQNHPYFRKYAFTNKQEFFAVCVEHFFETPAEFNLRYPELYEDLCHLLNQDPLRSLMDYKLND